MCHISRVRFLVYVPYGAFNTEGAEPHAEPQRLVQSLGEHPQAEPVPLREAGHGDFGSDGRLLSTFRFVLWVIGPLRVSLSFHMCH